MNLLKNYDMTRHIPGIIVGFKNNNGLYMIQESVVQDKGFLLDIKIGFKTAVELYCDRKV